MRCLANLNHATITLLVNITHVIIALLAMLLGFFMHVLQRKEHNAKKKELGKAILTIKSNVVNKATSHIIIENIGKSAAQNVEIMHDDNKACNWSKFDDNKISFLSPGSSHTLAVGTNMSCRKATITVRWTDDNGPSEITREISFI